MTGSSSALQSGLSRQQSSSPKNKNLGTIIFLPVDARPNG
jgi:hypothetical protein